MITILKDKVYKLFFMIIAITVVSCGDVENPNEIKSLNRVFAVSGLNSLTALELSIKDELCQSLNIKGELFSTSYLAKTFTFDTSFKDCSEDQRQEKTIVATLSSSTQFTSSDIEYAKYLFIVPELDDNSGSFAKFCQSSSNDRYIVSGKNLYHFYVTKSTNQINVESFSSFEEGTINGEKSFKTYKEEEIEFNNKASPDRPEGLVLKKTSRMNSNCSSLEFQEKINILKSLN